jgi:hypothetical protein
LRTSCRRDVYVSAVQAATGRAFTLNASETADGLNLVAVERAFTRSGWPFGQNEKALAVLWLVQLWAKDPNKVPAETRERGKKLIEAINAKV